jgi:hypothetical protein
MEKTFNKVRSTKDIVISAGLAVAGCVLVALPTSTSINILGFFMIFAGILLFLMLRSGYKEVESDAKFCKTERYFSQTLRTELAEKIASKPQSVNLAEEDKGNAVRLDVFYSKQTGKAYIQLFEYIPYKYEPCSKQYEYEISEVNNLI